MSFLQLASSLRQNLIKYSRNYLIQFILSEISQNVLFFEPKTVNLLGRKCLILQNVAESGKIYPHLSRDEREALNSFMNDDKIVIKSADKGSATVAWNTKDYLMEASSQLNDRTLYQMCQTAPLQKVNKGIKDILRDILNRKQIDKKIIDHLIMEKTQLGRFYLIPKIHKCRSNVPGCLVIPNNGTATKNIS